MTRENAQKLISDLLCGTHKECSNNHYRDVQLGINKIYDSFEKDLKDCKQCKHHLSENGNFPLEPCSECSLFYSNKWESKE